ncbi:helix-turn-helix domain-containing protein [Chitinophaga nivalis]|uniref:helix-turn-helix domain-containing protein n=1 Tax=Chitinophaga nivalis TaxID=2991709 RepID=UPI0035306880
MQLPGESVIHDIRTYLAVNLDKPFSISQLAKDYCISPSKLQHDFKKCFQESVSDYVLRMKMEKGRSMLHHSGKKISDIAYELGYSHRSSFTKLFRKFYGYSPREVKNICRTGFLFIVLLFQIYNNSEKPSNFLRYIDTALFPLNQHLLYH